MNQKNMILIVVAVACGLAAAVLTSSMSGKSQPASEQVPILVAARDLPMNTKLTKDELDAMVVPKMFTKESAPPICVNTREEMFDKRVTRPMRQGDFFVPQDLSDKATVELPPGFNMMTFPISRDQMVGGFAIPGSRVDILVSFVFPKYDRYFSLPVFRDMLVLAVDTATQVKQGTPAVQTVADISLAVTAKDSLLLNTIINRGIKMRLILLSDPEKRPKYPVDRDYTNEEIFEMAEGSFDPTRKTKAEQEREKMMVEELPVPNADLEAGTQLTEEVINSKFTMTKIVPPAPANVINNIREHEGKFLTKPLSASQFVPKSFVAAKAPSYGKPAPADDSASEKSGPGEVAKADAPEKKEPPVFWDVTVATTSGVKKFRYQVLKNGNYKFMGELKVEGTPDEEKKETEAPADKPRRQTIRQRAE